jgi:type II secretory pathway pseudopilin PulG
MKTTLPTAVAGRPRGISLLEVLVAAGILVVGLASVAAVLPAAGSRLAQATLEDRAAAAAAVAYADVVNRGLVNSVLFSGSAAVRARIFGAFPANSGTMAPTSVEPASSAAINARIDSTRGYILEDDLAYVPPTTADTPTNMFFGGTVGPREFRTGVCWGAMLATGTTAASGVPATLSIVTFKKPGTAKRLSLASTAGMFMISGTQPIVAEDDRKRFLPPCSYVLALAGTAAPPVWLKVTSSWQATTAAGTNSFAVLDQNPMRPWFISGTTNPYISSGTMSVLGFENVVRVDEYSVSLD